MSTTIQTGAVHRVALTVSDLRRSQQFYTELLGFNFLTDFGPKALLHNGSVLLALDPPPDPAQAIPADRFTENRIGLDHLSLSVASMADLQAAAGVLDAQGVSRRDQAAGAVRHCGAGIPRSRQHPGGADCAAWISGTFRSQVTKLAAHTQCI